MGNRIPSKTIYFNIENIKENEKNQNNNIYQKIKDKSYTLESIKNFSEVSYSKINKSEINFGVNISSISNSLNQKSSKSYLVYENFVGKIHQN